MTPGEEYGRRWTELLNGLIQEARNEALEEAAKVAEATPGAPYYKLNERIATAIRALKSDYSQTQES